jgi:hypothetical protein
MKVLSMALLAALLVPASVFCYDKAEGSVQADQKELLSQNDGVSLRHDNGCGCGCRRRCCGCR